MSDADPKPPTPTKDPVDERLYCPKCAYNLTGLSDSQCPECGTAFDRKNLRRDSMKWAAPYLGAGHIVLLMLAPAAVVLGEWIITLERNSEVGKPVILAGPVFAVIAAVVIGRRAARTFARRGAGDLAAPATILMIVIYAAAVLCLQATLMFFAFFGTCGTICACGALTRRF